MKKSVYKFMIALAMVGALSGCGSSNKVNEEKSNNAGVSDAKVEIDVKATAKRILEEGDFKDNLAEVDKDVALNRLYDIGDIKVADSMFYVNSNATAEEIAVIELESVGDVDKVKNAFEDRVDDQKKACKDYLPNEMPKLESAIIYSADRYVILCISNNNESALNIIKTICK